MFLLFTRFFRRYAITSNNRQLKKIIFDHSFYQTFIHYPIRNFSIQISTQALGNELHNFCTHSGRREASAYEAVWLRAKTSACGAKRMGKVGPRRNHKEFTRGVPRLWRDNALVQASFTERQSWPLPRIVTRNGRACEAFTVPANRSSKKEERRQPRSSALYAG